MDAAIGYCRAQNGAAAAGRGGGHTLCWWGEGPPLSTGTLAEGTELRLVSQPSPLGRDHLPQRHQESGAGWKRASSIHLMSVPPGPPVALLAQDQVCTSRGEDSHIQPCSTPKERPCTSSIPEQVWALICSSPTFNQTIYSRSTFWWELKAIL